jgi:salicylate hydroxylase
MPMSGRNVIVIGGGIAGLAVARALQRRGAQVQVLEQAGAFREVGAGLQISPNGARVLQALGMEQALLAHTQRSTAVTLRKGGNGARVLRMDLPASGPGFHMLHRADLVAMLQAALPGQITRLGTKVASVNVDGPRPSVVLEDGEVLRADLVIGADGLHSVTRAAVLGDQPKPFFTGQVAWRALIPCDGDPSEAQVFMGPGRHLVSYPLRGGKLRNIIAVEERKDWTAEGWNHADDPANLRAAFAGFGGPVPAWLAQVKQVYLWGLFRHPVADHWHKGHTAILGDAAHPTLPFMAQGANMALEDAWVLARCVATADTIPQGLAAYQAARRNRVLRVIEAANRNARNYHLRGPMADLAHLALRAADKITPNAALRQFGWIYDHDVTAS